MMSRRTPIATSYNRAIVVILIVSSIITITLGLLYIGAVFIFRFNTVSEPFETILKEPTIATPRSITPTPLPTLTQQQREQLVEELKNLKLENLPQEALDEILNAGNPTNP